MCGAFMEWTRDQREAIEYRGENILLAAAAGSGKTAVLVQRIIELVSNPEKPIDISSLLVLTFTDAAAKEMREKISGAIEKELSKQPENAHLQKQKLLLGSASISTIHSFCLQLLKNNIHMTDLPVNFGLISETENKMLLDEVLDGILERFYGRVDKDKSIRDLVMGYGGIKNDNSLRETVLGLFRFSMSMAYPAKWLNDAVGEFRKVCENDTLEGSFWQKYLSQRVIEAQRGVLDIYDDIISLSQEHLGFDHPYRLFFEDESTDIKRLFEHVDIESYSSVRENIFNFEFKRMPSGVRGAEGEVFAVQEKVKALRKLAKGLMEDLEELFKIPEEDAVERIRESYPVVRTLKNIVLILRRTHIKRKREKNFLDFSDLEHEALRLIEGSDNENNKVAETLREKYCEILIDEYQDTNNIQDTIFSKVSRNDSNIFMVGDLKQSIYTFRNAVPKLFADKYLEYGSECGKGHLIRLFRNFRSREAVVDLVNYIFSGIMNEDVGDVNYTEEEFLVHGEDCPMAEGCDFVPEFHFVCSNGETPEGEEPLSKHELEAHIAASRVRDIVKSGQLIFDKSKKVLRPVEYRDIVVLMRNTKAAAPVFEQIFEEQGIPIYSEVGRSYLSSLEVQTVLSFLQIVDNPRQDIPLIAVMRSPIWGFSPEELGEMRSKMKKGSFFDAVENAADLGNEKAKAFLDDLESLRERAERESTEKLIWSIYYEYGYYAYAGVGGQGVRRQANLRLLFERTAEFEHSGLSGLFNFMNYIESVKSRGEDLTPARTLSEDDNVVRIMTIHKSKGLEFPVVILADTGHDFNMMDLNKNIIWNSDAGLGLDYVDTKMRIRYPSVSRDVVACCSKNELFSEEMRLLYVAFTRAREKLIVIGSFKKTKSGISIPLYMKDGRVKPPYIKGKKCFRDWILAAVLCHPDAQNLRDYFEVEGIVPVRKSAAEIKTFVYDNQSEIDICNGKVSQDKLQMQEGCMVGDEELLERIGYNYPNEHLTKVPVKLSVSEVKRMQAEEDRGTLPISQLRELSPRPLGGVKATERGTIVHFVLQMAEPEKINSADDVDGLVDQLVEKKVISSEQARAVDSKRIFKFFDSSIGRRLRNAVRVEREFSFYTKAQIGDVYGIEQEGEILLQGTMDCFFCEEDGRIVLIDFKTDRAGNRQEAEEIAKRYYVQMKYYKKALEEILDEKVHECYLFFLDCSEAIEV